MTAEVVLKVVVMVTRVIVMMIEFMISMVVSGDQRWLGVLGDNILCY